MSHKLMNFNDNNHSLSKSLIAQNFGEFLSNHSDDITGLVFSVSVKDKGGVWHTLTQRLFKNGSIHIKKH